MATVYLAEDLKHRRKVALKVLRPELAATLGPQRFLREIEIAAQLQHPHILPLLDSGEAEGFLYYVMPFIDGESLRDRLARQGELPIPEAVRVLAEVADALAHAHSRGVVHRDIKPDNVMLTGRHALVTDFGVAKAVSEATGRQTMTTAGVALGTPAYMAPEQATADPHVDHRADLYALGAMGYELLTGRPPFTGITPQQVLAAHVTQTADPVTAHRASVSPLLSDVIMKCLAKRPSDRWQSAEELLVQLEPLAATSGGTTPTHTVPVTAVTGAVDPWYGHPVRVGGLFALVSVAVLGVVYFLTVQLGLPYWVLWTALGLLGVGLPIMVVTGLRERRRARARTTGISVQTPTGVDRLFTWRRAISGGVLAFGVLAAGTIVYTGMRLLGIGPVGTLVASGKLASRDKLIVADFENRTADTTLGPSITEAFRIDLAQSPVINLVSSAAVSQALQRMERSATGKVDAALAREVAVREGAKGVVAGEISPVGSGYVFSARLLSAADGTELVALRETAEDARGILGAIDRLSKRLRERIGESLRTIRSNEPLEQVTTGSLEALRLYSEAVRVFNQGEQEKAGTLLEQAIALDSGFAMAYRKLAAIIGNTGGRRSEMIAVTTKAYEHRDRLPEVERDLTTARYYQDVDIDDDKGIAAYRAALAINPNDGIALTNLGIILQRHRRLSEAESLYSRAIAEGSFVFDYDHLADIQVAQGKFTEARATLKRMADAYPGNPVIAWDRGTLAMAEGAYDSAEVYYRTVAATFKDQPTQAYTWWTLFNLDRMRGRLASAVAHSHQASVINQTLQLPRSLVGDAIGVGSIDVLYRNAPAAGVRVVDSALRKYPLNSMPAIDRPYSDLATFYALAGKVAEAKQLMAEYEANVPVSLRRGDPYRHQAAGTIALAERRAADAIREFQALYDESGCTNCALFELGQAQELAGQPDSALAAYERAVTSPGYYRLPDESRTRAWALRRLGEMYEGRGDRAKAIDYYSKFVDLWRGADAELQPQVKEIKDRLARLAGEKKP